MHHLVTKIGILLITLTAVNANSSSSVCESYSANGLYEAAKNDNLSLLQTMLSCPEASINGDGIDVTPLKGAIVGAAINTFNYLINAGADINLSNAPFVAIGTVGWNPSENSNKILKTLLLDMRLDVTAKAYGQTLLIAAVIAGHSGAVEALLSREGIDVNARTRGGDTAYLALRIAIQNSKSPHELLKILNLLLRQKNIQVNSTNDLGLDLAWYLGFQVMGSFDYLELAKVALTSSKVNINKFYSYTEEPGSNATFLMWYPYSGSPSIELIKAVLARGDVDLYLKDEKGRTAYDRAIEMHQVEAAKLIREAMERK